MKKKIFLSGVNAKLALAAVALTSVMFTSCEKEEFNVAPVELDPASATVAITVYDLSDGSIINGASITENGAAITSNPFVIEAGQFATLTPTIILQEEDAETKIVAVPTTSTDEKTKEKVWDNYELYWYSIPSFTYVEKSGAKVVEGSKKINTDDLIERAAIESFFNTLENTYTEHIESTKDGEYSVYANSRTTASITYTIVTTEYNVVKQAVTKADADALGSIKVDDYTTSKLSVSENQDIPGHGHSHGHGHGHGEGNAGGGVGELD